MPDRLEALDCRQGLRDLALFRADKDRARLLVGRSRVEDETSGTDQAARNARHGLAGLEPGSSGYACSRWSNKTLQFGGCLGHF